jgi:hypothetical protein
MLDLFCGRWGWSKAFAARGWECVGVDLVEPPEIPQGCSFVECDVFQLRCAQGSRIWSYRPHLELGEFDFICASSPCEQFSVHGMKHFHPNPPYPELGIKLFNHTRSICEASGVPYVMENVRAAQQFVGNAAHHCGPFYLWGSGVPAIMPQGIRKGISMGGDKFKGLAIEERRELRRQYAFLQGSSRGEQRRGVTAAAATIPPELANCVADYAERLIEQRKEGVPCGN